MKTTYSDRSTQTSIDSVMTPMIDVVFLLLVFFLATASFQRLEKTLPSASAADPKKTPQGNQPDQEPPQALTDLSDVIVQIKSGQPNAAEVSYVLNGEPVADFAILAQRIKALLRIRADVPLVIDPEDGVPAGEAIRIYDTARANGSVAVFLVAR